MEVINEAARLYDEKLVLKKKQVEALLHLTNRKGDLIVSLPVGYGKSIIYHLLPRMLGNSKNNSKKPVVLVISPLNIIQDDQRLSLARHNISCCTLDICANVDGSFDDEDDVSSTAANYSCQTEVNLEHVKRGNYSIILCHPEALLNTARGKDLLRSELQDHVVAVVIDECHIIEKWGEEFRTAFHNLRNLKVFFPDAPFLGMSGTPTVKQKKELPNHLGLIDYSIFESSPDKPNLFLEKMKKRSTADVEEEYELITHAICDKLYCEREKFPVTLLFIPVHYMSKTLSYLNSLFKPINIDDAIYSAICSGQDQYIIDKTLHELKSVNSHIRLVLTTSILGMGFDSDCVTNIIHACPPRNVSQYFQEIGRAGRRGQSSTALLHYSFRNIARNLPGINEDIISYCTNDTSCLRNQLLSVVGYEKESVIQSCKCCSFCRDKCICDDCLLFDITLSD